VLAASPGGALPHPGLAEWPASQRNTIRYTFLHPAARELTAGNRPDHLAEGV
jgi:hypothetical protein